MGNIAGLQNIILDVVFLIFIQTMHIVIPVLFPFPLASRLFATVSLVSGSAFEISLGRTRYG